VRIHKLSITFHPYVLLFISILAVSVSSIMIKSSDTPTSVAGMYRLFLSVMIMLPFVSWKRLRLISMSKKEWSTVILAGFLLGLHFLFWMESLKYTSVASSMVILTLQPLFVMIGTYYLFGERRSRLSMLGLAGALIGTVIIAWGDIGVSREALIGDGLSLIGAIAVSGYMLAGQQVSRKLDANLYSILVFLVGGSVLLGYNLFNHTPLSGYNSSDWTYFVMLAIIPTIFGQNIFNQLLKSIGATTVSVGIIGEPVLAIILAFLILGEGISGFQLLGGFITVFGMAGYFWAPALAQPVTEQKREQRSLKNSVG
jgi:drug/metabolite transporter (DMT)-like permease